MQKKKNEVRVRCAYDYNVSFSHLNWAYITLKTSFYNRTVIEYLTFSSSLTYRSPRFLTPHLSSMVCPATAERFCPLCSKNGRYSLNTDSWLRKCSYWPGSTKKETINLTVSNTCFHISLHVFYVLLWTANNISFCQI